MLSRRTLVALSLLLLAPTCAWAEDPLEQELTIAAIQSRVAAVEASQQLDAAAKVEAKKLLEEARDGIAQAEKSKARVQELRRLTAAAPQQLALARAELARKEAVTRPVPPSKASLAELEGLRGAAEANLKELREEIGRLRQESAERSVFLQRASELIANASGQLTATEEALKGRQPVRGLLEVAERLAALARRRMVAEELRRLKAEQSSYLARRDLLQSRLDVLGRRVRAAERLVTAWQELEAEQRRVETEAREREAQRVAQTELVQRVPALGRLVEHVKTLSREGKALAPQLRSTLRMKGELEKQLATLREQFGVTRRKVETAGVTVALGLLLRRQLTTLPSPRRLGGRLASRQDEIAATQYRLILLEEERALPAVADLDLGTREIMLSLPSTVSAGERGEVEQIAREQLRVRRESLDALKAALESQLQSQVDVDLAGRRLRSAIREYRSFLEEQILWVPSVPRGAKVTGAGAVEALEWLCRSRGWETTWTRTWRSGRWRVIVLALAVLLLCLVRGRVRRGLEHTGRTAWEVPRGTLPQTLRAVLYTTLLAAPLPLAAWGLGTILAVSEAPTKISLAVGAGLRDMGLTWLVLEFLRQTLRGGGLGACHFRWPSAMTSLLRFHLTWLLPVLLFTTLISTALDTQELPAWNESLGRLAFLIAMIALSIFAWRVLRPEGAVVARLRERNRDGWLHRLRWIWLPLAVGVPLVFSVLAIRGYYYTAQQLEGRLQWTLVLVLGLGLLAALQERWLRLAKLRFLSRPADPEPVITTEETEGEPRADAVEPAPITAPTPPPVIDLDVDLDLEPDDKSDLATSRRQAQQLFRSMLLLTLLLGGFLIWGNHLPALRRLERIQVWPNPGQTLDAERTRYPALEGPSLAKPPAPTPAVAPAPAAPVTPAAASPLTPTGVAPPVGDTGDVLRGPLTVAGLGLAIMLIVFMLVAAKNLPGLVDIILSQRSTLDAGIRFAASSILRYLILAIGIGAALSTIGLRWSSVQWLVAALTFGLAFGLQEIFANFVSGLIILFERPVRIGDWVSIGEMSGIVTKIRIRATTVRDFDRKEHMIPNKTIVTGEVVNWALSDSVMRLKLPVAVAYGSDVALVRATLLEIVKAQPEVLPTPAPKVHFMAVGERGVFEFEIRCFVPHPNKRLATRNGILDQVDIKFRERGIKIAFPQHDLHLRSLPSSGEPPLEEFLAPGTDDAGT